MKPQEAKQMLTELVVDCADHTIKTLKELAEDKTPAAYSLRTVITPILIKAWEKMPVSLGIPEQLEKLHKYYDKPFLYSYHAGKIIHLMYIIKGEETESLNLN